MNNLTKYFILFLIIYVITSSEFNDYKNIDDFKQDDTL